MIEFCVTRMALVAGMSALGLGSARADSRVLITSVESAEVALDEDSRMTIDTAWAEAAAAIEEWRVVGTGVSTSLLRRDGGCGELDERCLERAAERRGTDRILLTSIHRTVEAEDQVELRIRLFDRYTGTVRGTYQTTLELDDLDSSRELASLAAELMPLIGGLPAEGAAVVRAAAGSTVFIDGVLAGTVPASGELAITPIPVGRRELRVVRPSRTVWEAPVVIRPRESITVSADVGSAATAVDANAPRYDYETAFPDPGEAWPTWVLTAPGIVISRRAAVVTEGDEVSRVRFRIPMIEDHVRRGEIRTTVDARVGFVPRVSSRGARFTAKLRF